MYRRLNITLPEETVRLIDRIAKAGSRSRFIDEAVREFARRKRRLSLGRQLEQGARRRAARDLVLAEEWAGLEEEAWHRDRG